MEKAGREGRGNCHFTIAFGRAGPREPSGFPDKNDAGAKNLTSIVSVVSLSDSSQKGLRYCEPIEEQAEGKEPVRIKKLGRIEWLPNPLGC